MKKGALLILLGSFLFVQASAQAPIWEKSYLGATSGGRIEVTADGHLLSSAEFSMNLLYGYQLVKYDSLGNENWRFTSGALGPAGTVAFTDSPDGKVLFAGNIAGPVASNPPSVFLQQIEANGDTSTTFRQQFDYPLSDYPTAMVVLDSGQVAISGTRTTTQGMTLRKTDAAGNLLWLKQFAVPNFAGGSFLVRNNAGNLVWLGTGRQQPSPTPKHPFVLVTNTNGDSLFSKFLVIQDTLINEQPLAIITNADGGYLISGIMEEKGFLAKLDSAFSLVWQYQLPPVHGTHRGVSKTVELPDQTLLLFSKESGPGATNDFYLTHLSSTGIFLNQVALQTQYCAPGQSRITDFTVLPDNSLAFCGVCSSSPTTQYRGYISRWTGFGTVMAAAETHNKPAALTFSPNPASGFTDIALSGSCREATLQLYSVTGRKVLQLQVNNTARVNLQQLPAGLYLYQAQAGDTVLSGKLVVE